MKVDQFPSKRMRQTTFWKPGYMTWSPPWPSGLTTQATCEKTEEG